MVKTIFSYIVKNSKVIIWIIASIMLFIIGRYSGERKADSIKESYQVVLDSVKNDYQKQYLILKEKNQKLKDSLRIVLHAQDSIRTNYYRKIKVLQNKYNKSKDLYQDYTSKQLQDTMIKEALIWLVDESN